MNSSYGNAIDAGSCAGGAGLSYCGTGDGDLPDALKSGDAGAGSSVIGVDSGGNAHFGTMLSGVGLACRMGSFGGDADLTGDVTTGGVGAGGVGAAGVGRMIPGGSAHFGTMLSGVEIACRMGSFGGGVDLTGDVTTGCVGAGGVGAAGAGVKSNTGRVGAGSAVNGTVCGVKYCGIGLMASSCGGGRGVEFRGAADAPNTNGFALLSLCCGCDDDLLGSGCLKSNANVDAARTGSAGGAVDDDVDCEFRGSDAPNTNGVDLVLTPRWNNDGDLADPRE